MVWTLPGASQAASRRGRSPRSPFPPTTTKHDDRVHHGAERPEADLVRQALR